jgi:hypothetical protein
MRRTQADIEMRTDHLWDVKVATWDFYKAGGVASRDDVIESRSKLDDAGVLSYLRELVRAGTLRRDSYAQVLSPIGGANGPTPRVGELLNRTRPISPEQS